MRMATEVGACAGLDPAAQTRLRGGSAGRLAGAAGGERARGRHPLRTQWRGEIRVVAGRAGVRMTGRVEGRRSGTLA